MKAKNCILNHFSSRFPKIPNWRLLGESDKSDKLTTRSDISNQLPGTNELCSSNRLLKPNPCCESTNVSNNFPEPNELRESNKSLGPNGACESIKLPESNELPKSDGMRESTELCQSSDVNLSRHTNKMSESNKGDELKESRESNALGKSNKLLDSIDLGKLNEMGMKVGISFDLMSCQIGDVAKLELYLPAFEHLFKEPEKEDVQIDEKVAGSTQPKLRPKDKNSKPTKSTSKAHQKDKKQARINNPQVLS